MDTRIVAGIDEAGLGPMLGPLTLGICVLRLPRELKGSLWKRLQGAVSARIDREDKRLIVGDSKQVFTRNPRGHKRLERTVLAFLGQQTQAAAVTSFRELVERAPAELRPSSKVLARHPWYRDLPDPLPTWTDAEECTPYVERLASTLNKAQVEVLNYFPRLVTAGQLNASYEETENKSVTTWRLCADLIAWYWQTYGDQNPELVVDRQGGRLHYAPLLWEHLPDTWIETRTEGRGGCEYIVHGERGTMRVIFREKADQDSFCVALASCVAKYLREISMTGFNAYFQRLQEGLRPTAGYVTDARRWLSEAGPALEAAQLDEGVLVRQR